jgi:curli biogenesis system outer membrane secretion channel CsgG
MRVRGIAMATMALALAGSWAAAAGKAGPTIAVLDFDYGTVGYHWWGDYDIGKGMADQVVDALVNDSPFRVVERKKLQSVLGEQDLSNSKRAEPSQAQVAKLGKMLGAKYIIAGSITKFGGEDKKIGGGGLIKGKLGGLGLKKAKTEVALTARVIDATTGEIIASVKGEGESRKGGGIVAGAGGWGGGGVFSMSSSDYKSSAIGEAQEEATKKLVAEIVNKKDRLE